MKSLAKTTLILLTVACKGGDGGDGGTDGTTSAVSLESTFGHSASDPSDPSSMTFTNSSDPVTTDPVTTDPVTTDPVTTDPVTTEPATDATTDPTTTTDPTADTSDTVDPSTSTDPTASESDTSNPGGPCCEAQDMAGCGDANIEACVCASESFCCDVEWDVVCTVQTVLLGCAECPGIGGDGDCCAAHGNPGCDDEQVEQCVCNEDYVCCVDPWDDICVGIAMNRCGAPC